MDSRDINMTEQEASIILQALNFTAKSLDLSAAEEFQKISLLASKITEQFNEKV